MAADTSATRDEARSALNPYFVRMCFLFGAIPPTAPMSIPTDAKFANPQSTYVQNQAGSTNTS